MDASILSKKFYDKYNFNIQQINTSIFNNLSFTEEVRGLRPNILIFNPPYVPVEQEEIDNEHKYLVHKLKHIREHKECVREKDQNLIAYSYMGGLDGLEVTRKILGRIGWCCTAYFIVMGKEGVE
jgi:methylase of polypeptide subunit release factors